MFSITEYSFNRVAIVLGYREVPAVKTVLIK
jgi:hypothetical protein